MIGIIAFDRGACTQVAEQLSEIGGSKGAFSHFWTVSVREGTCGARVRDECLESSHLPPKGARSAW